MSLLPEQGACLQALLLGGVVGKQSPGKKVLRLHRSLVHARLWSWLLILHIASRQSPCAALLVLQAYVAIFASVDRAATRRKVDGLD